MWKDNDHLLDESGSYDDTRSKVFREPKRWTRDPKTTVSTSLVKLCRARTYSKNAVGHHRRRLSKIGESVPTKEVTRTMKMAPIRKPSLSEEFVVVQDSGVGDAVDISF